VARKTGRWLQAVALGVLMLGGCPRAYADPQVELSGAAGFGLLAAGITSGRFTISPSASLSVRGERAFFVARDTASFLGATGGRFGINNELSLGGGLSWERVNASAGLSLVAFSLPTCGPSRWPGARPRPRGERAARRLRPLSLRKALRKARRLGRLCRRLDEG